MPRPPIRVTVHIFQARLSREGAKAEAINCHEDRVPCDCRRFRKRTPTNKAAVTRTVFPDRPDPCDSWPIATLLQLPQSDNCHKDRGPTVNKAIIVSRQVGRRYPTTNQRNTKMIVTMMIMIIVIIIINIIMSMGLPNTPNRSKHAGGNHPTHTTPQGGKGGNHQSPHPNHTTPQGGGKQPTTTTTEGGGKQPTTTPHHRGGEGGRRTENRDHICVRVCTLPLSLSLCYTLSVSLFVYLTHFFMSHNCRYNIYICMYMYV